MRFNFRVIPAILWLVLSLAILPLRAGHAEIPDVVIAQDESLPLWISASAALEEGNQLKWEMFSLQAERGIREKLLQHYATFSTEPSPRKLETLEEMRSACIWTGVAGGRGSAAPGTARPDGTLMDLGLHSEAIFEGLVVGEAVGFLYDRPGVLLEVAIQRTLKRTDATEPEDTLFVFYPEAMIPIGDDLLCATAHRDFEKPEVGQPILVFEFPGERLAESFLAPFPGHLIFVSDGQLSLPKGLRESPNGPSVNLDEMGAVVEAVSKNILVLGEKRGN